MIGLILTFSSLYFQLDNPYVIILIIMWLIIITATLLILFINSLRLSSSTLAFFRGHSLGKQTARKRVNAMNWWFVSGVLFFIWLIISSLTLVSYLMLEIIGADFYWIIIVAILILELVLMAIAYSYQSSKQNPWISQNFRHYLLSRCQKTKSTAEAMMLGMATIVGQLPIIIGPALAFCLAIANFYQPHQHHLLLTISLTSFGAVISLIAITIQSLTGRPVTKVIDFNRRFHRFLNFIALAILAILTIVILAILTTGNNSF